MESLKAALSKAKPPEPDEQFLKHKVPTKHAITSTQIYDVLSLAGQPGPGFYAYFCLEPPKLPPPVWMNGLKPASDRLVELREIQWADVKF